MATAQVDRVHGPGSFQRALRMARYGHRDWLCWTDRDGAHAVRATPENLKTVLLATGTKGHWTLISASDAVPTKGFWWLGINVLRQMKRGWR